MTILTTLRIVDSRESIFDYKYLLELESNIERLQQLCKGPKRKRLILKYRKTLLVVMSL
jgi:hypothetical protein